MVGSGQASSPYLLGVLLGVPIGLAILHALPTATLMLVFGGVLLIYAAYSIFEPARACSVSVVKGSPAASPRAWWAWPAG